jgi:hypothetical protein
LDTQNSMAESGFEIIEATAKAILSRKESRPEGSLVMGDR